MSGSTSTSWEALAGKHLGHRAVLRDPGTLECVQCGHKLLLPREPAGTPTPPPWRPDRTDLVPMPSGLRDRVAAEIDARKRARQEQRS